MVDPTRITRGTAPTRGTHTQWLAAETAGKIVPEGVLCISKDRLYSGSIEYFMGDGVNGYSKLSKQGNEWIAMSQTATRSSDYVFTVPGDLTGALKASRALRMNASSVVTVVSSAYASDITTVTVYGATLPASLTGWEMAKADVTARLEILPSARPPWNTLPAAARQSCTTTWAFRLLWSGSPP